MSRSSLKLLAVPIVATMVISASVWTTAQKATPAVVNADLPPGAMQAKATTACTECHDARIILQQRLGKAAWTKEVDKMVKWGAVVELAERDGLIEYLSTNFGPDQPPYQPSRTSSEKKIAPKASK